MNITPKIDYALLGEAVQFYKSLGYEYREVPWAVPAAAIDATLPPECDRVVLVVGNKRRDTDYHTTANELVGSAEQGFITLDLPPGRYVGVTPCFRVEDQYDILRQSMFMKVELFDNRAEPDAEVMVIEAERFAHGHGVKAVRVDTDIGADLMVDGVEIGSYGYRNIAPFGRWAYGTGLALPRFSVAKAFQSMVA